MPLGDRDYIGGQHPATCTCTECVRRRLKRLERDGKFDPRFTSNGEVDIVLLVTKLVQKLKGETNQ